MYAPRKSGEGVLVNTSNGWEYGTFTGQSDQWGEHFKVEYSGNVGWFHSEDIKET